MEAQYQPPNTEAIRKKLLTLLRQRESERIHNLPHRMFKETETDAQWLAKHKAHDSKLLTAALRLRERLSHDSWYQQGEQKSGALFWLRLAETCPNLQ